jgi:RNA polymerase sigma-70 factor (ECF subfamily)
MKVYMHYSKFKGKASLKTWIYRIGLNEVYTRFRKRKKHIQNREWEFEESIKGFSKVDWELEAGDLKRDFCEFIRFLPKKRSKVMFLRVLEKMSFKEIGETLGISEASAKNLFSMGLKDIRKKMEEGNHGSGNAKMAIHADRH